MCTSREHIQQRISLCVNWSSTCSLAISVAAGPGWLEERVEQVYKQEEGYSETATALFLLDLGPPQVGPGPKSPFFAIVLEQPLYRIAKPSSDALDGVQGLRLAYSTLFLVSTGSQPSSSSQARCGVRAWLQGEGMCVVNLAPSLLYSTRSVHMSGKTV